MAIYHFNTKPISRSQGRSIVACAAYRAGESLQDERYGKEHDYSKKQDVAYSAILLPENAPEFMRDREQLWNNVEAIEKRKDARLAREVQFSLPRELTLEQNIALAKEFVQKTFVDGGMVADMSIHVDAGKDGEAQPHVHVLLATREVTAAGFGLKNPDWNKQELLVEWRGAWADVANRHLAMHGHDVRIDQRSYAAQGIELEPQTKIGAAVAQERMARTEDHQRIARENGERIYNDPGIALDALTRQQSTFTHQDLARFINRHTENAEQFQSVYAKVQLSSELVVLGKDDQGRERLTTREMLDTESAMLNHASLLKEQRQHAVKEAALVRATASRSLSGEQQNALKYVTGAEGLACVVGFAGTGKSYMLGAAREVWESSGYNVRGVALSGIAAQNLTQSSGIESRTMASLLYGWDKGHGEAGGKDIFVVDEAGMLGSRQMEQLVSEAAAHGAKVVLVGDWQQLQAIEAGAAFRAIAEEHQYAELSEVRRQQVDWQRESTLDLARGKVESALAAYRAHDNVHEYATQAEAKAQMMEQWNDTRHTSPQETQIILAYTRVEVQELNNMARDLKKRDGELGKDHTVATERGQRQFAAGDRVYFLKRDDDLHVVNGTLGTIRAIDGATGQMQVQLDRDDLTPGEQLVTVDTKEYNHLDHGYAATVYKAQGVTVDRTYILASRYYDAHSAYVGMSRHREGCDIFASREEFTQSRDLITTFARDRTKDITVDYTQPEREYARQRDIMPAPHSQPQQTRTAEKHTENRQEKRSKQKEKEFDEKRIKTAQEKKSREEKRLFMEQSLRLTERFKAANPELARQITGKIVPEHETRANATMQKLSEYQQSLKQNILSTQDKAEFAKVMKEVTQLPLVMNHIKQREPRLARMIEQLAKDQKLQRSLGPHRGL
jgi:Ti-type conjugative transfer relaxase TraA